MLYVGQHQGLVSLGHQDAGGALLGFLEPDVGGATCWMVKMAGTKV